MKIKNLQTHSEEHTHSLTLTLLFFYQDPTVASIAMRIVYVPASYLSNSIAVQLEHANMVFDPIPG